MFFDEVCSTWNSRSKKDIKQARALRGNISHVCIGKKGENMINAGKENQPLNQQLRSIIQPIVGARIHFSSKRFITK